MNYRFFVFAQEYLDIPQKTIKATVLIETILASFELNEILFELRDHSAGLNCGRWDYIFSYIKKFLKMEFPKKVSPFFGEFQFLHLKRWTFFRVWKNMTIFFEKAFFGIFMHFAGRIWAIKSIGVYHFSFLRVKMQSREKGLFISYDFFWAA